jgi:hypothetical protein
MLHYSCNSSRDRLNGSIWIRSELLWCYFSWCTNSHSANAVSVKLVSSKKSQYNVHLQSVPLPPLWSFNFILNRQDVSHTTIYDRCVAVGFRPTVNISYSCYVMITWYQFSFKKNWWCGKNVHLSFHYSWGPPGPAPARARPGPALCGPTLWGTAARRAVLDSAAVLNREHGHGHYRRWTVPGRHGGTAGTKITYRINREIITKFIENHRSITHESIQNESIKIYTHKSISAVPRGRRRCPRRRSSLLQRRRGGHPCSCGGAAGRPCSCDGRSCPAGGGGRTQATLQFTWGRRRLAWPPTVEAGAAAGCAPGSCGRWRLRAGNKGRVRPGEKSEWAAAWLWEGGGEGGARIYI